jgi:integrase
LKNIIAHFHCEVPDCVCWAKIHTSYLRFNASRNFPKRSALDAEEQAGRQATVGRFSINFEATHLLKKGVNLRYMQELPGHESSKTTPIYTHISHKGRDTIKSPIDDFNILKIFFVCRFAK